MRRKLTATWPDRQGESIMDAPSIIHWIHIHSINQHWTVLPDFSSIMNLTVWKCSLLLAWWCRRWWLSEIMLIGPPSPLGSSRRRHNHRPSFFKQPANLPSLQPFAISRPSIPIGLRTLLSCFRRPDHSKNRRVYPFNLLPPSSLRHLSLI